MAALAIVTQLLRSGEGVLASDDMYGGTVRLLTRVLDHKDHPVHFCDHTDLQQVERQLQQHPHIKIIMVSERTHSGTANQLARLLDVRWLTAEGPLFLYIICRQTETPTNPLMRSVSQPPQRQTSAALTDDSVWPQLAH